MLVNLALQYLAPILLTALAGLAGEGLRRLAVYLKAKTQDAKKQALIDRIESFAEVAVADVEQTVKPNVGQLATVRDGKLTVNQAAATQLKEAAMTRMRTFLPDHKEEIGKVLGLDPDATDKLLAAHVEKAVANLGSSE